MIEEIERIKKNVAIYYEDTEDIIKEITFVPYSWYSRFTYYDVVAIYQGNLTFLLMRNENPLMFSPSVPKDFHLQKLKNLFPSICINDGNFTIDEQDFVLLRMFW